MNSKRITALILAGLTAASLASCGNQGATSSQSSGAASQSGSASTAGQDNGLNPVGTNPISKETQTLSLLISPNTLVEDYPTNDFTKLIEEGCNVKLDFSYLPATEPANKLAIMVTSGETLPDVVNYKLEDTTLYKYAQTGAFVSLSEYYDTSSVNVKKYAEQYPNFNIMESITSPDGKIYTVPQFTKEYHSEVRFKYWINTKWLENLNLSMPKTTEEFHSVLKAFKENDPNGNGKQDEIPLVGGTGWSQDVTKNLMNAFTFEEAEGDLFTVDNGTLSVSYVKPQWKEGLKYMNGLVNEGLLDPLSFTQDDSQLRALVNNEEACLVGAFAFSSITLMAVATNPWLDQYAAMEPLTGPEGVSLASYATINAAPQWYVTKDAKNKELAFRVGDYLFNEELYCKSRYGEEGVNWEPAKEGDVGSFEDMGFAPKYRELENIWAIAQNKHWRGEQPMFAFDYLQGSVRPEDPNHYLNRIFDAVKLYINHKPADGTYVPKLTYSDEELDQISEIRSSLQTYVKESKTRFITGDMDIEKQWDAFQNEVKNIGLEELLKVSQQAYDRMYK